MNLTPSYLTVNPSYVLPEALIQLAQPSGAFELLAGSDLMVRLGEGDLMVYAKRLDVRTKVAAGNSAYNQLPSCTVVGSMVSTPAYLIRTRAEYDHHDTAAATRWGYNIVEAQRLAMRQGIYQQTRNALLYGFNPANGEGLLNTPGATTSSLPADPYGNTTVMTYDNGAMAIYLLTVIQQLKARTLQTGMPNRIAIVGPQRILGMFEYQNIVQLGSYQRVGGGTTTTGGLLRDIVRDAGDTVDWTYDDTLIGKGAGGTDAIILAVPEITKPKVGKPSTNAFSTLMPGMDASTFQFCDMAAPREIPTPLPGGAIDVVSELRITSGWALRAEAITIISMQYQ